MKDIAKDIHDQALKVGFEGCGIIPLLPYVEEYKAQVGKRMENVPESKQFYENLAGSFIKTQQVYPWAKSLIVCTTYFGKYKFPKSLQGRYGKAFLLSTDPTPNGNEYKRKTSFEQWLLDNGIRFAGGEQHSSILPMRLAAVRAGLGIFRKNNFFYGEKGSWYSIDGYLIDKECEYINETRIRPCAEKCNICQRECKTKALSAPYSMNPGLCVSFWTTFGGGYVPPFLKEEDFGEWICGCDMCQDRCPHNRHNWDDGEDFPGLDEIVELLEPENIINASDEELIEKVIPKTDHHIPPEKTEILRVNARRVIERLRCKSQTSSLA